MIKKIYSSHRGEVRIAAALFIAVAVLAGAAYFVSVDSAQATQTPKVDICHATGSSNNPYNSQSVDKNATAGGHDGHGGDVYPADDWGDIIPPYDYRSYEVVGTKLECPNGYPKVSSKHPGYCYKRLIPRWPRDYKKMVEVDDYDWVDHHYDGKNWPEGEEIWNNDCEVPVQKTLRVCKTIVDSVGNTSDGSGTPGTTFTIELDPGDDAVFTTPLDLNTNLYGDDEDNDSECISYEVEDGSYDYSEEAIGGDNTGLWETPLYDELTQSGDFEEYDTSGNSNGNVVVSDDLPERTIVVKNTIRPVAKIIAHKVICDDESLLPNQDLDEPIDENTASDWALEHDGCELSEDWEFQWAYAGANYPGGDHYGEAGDEWTTFSNMALIDVSNEPSRIEMREVLQEGYLPFSDDGEISAEFYCANDVGNYDNWEWITNPKAGETYYCVGFNYLEQERNECVLGEELVLNGSFETPGVSDDSGWDIFSNGTSGLEWLVSWASAFVGAPDPANAELHGGVNGWLAYEGEQYVELDSDWNGHGEGPNGEESSTVLSQNLPTATGEDYDLTFTFSPRPGTDENENKLEVWWGGALLDTLSADGTSNGNTDWALNSYTVNATGETTLLEFKDAGDPNSTGTFLDDVSVQCVVENDPPDPEYDFTIVAHKIVCDDESYLPNWGPGAAKITDETADNHVQNSDGHCWFAEGWEFEWGLEGVTNPGDDLYGYGGVGWNTFGPTDEFGETSISLDVDELSYPGSIWMREVLKEGFIPFSYGPNGNSDSDDYSAEMYCDADVLHYDNYDRIANPESGNTYYCVAFNYEDKPQCLVEGYKYDEQGNPLSGWEIGLAGGGLLQTAVFEDDVADDDSGPDQNPPIIDTDFTDENGYYCLFADEVRKAPVYQVGEYLQDGWSFFDVEINGNTGSPASGDSFFDIFVDVELFGQEGPLHVDWWNQYGGSQDLPECSDGINNDDGDGDIDENDDGCHTDGDSSNPDSYDPNDDDESDERIFFGSGGYGPGNPTGGGEVLGATFSQCGIYLNDYLSREALNDPFEVKKLQLFLIMRGYNLEVTGVFDDATYSAVVAFQAAFQDEVLNPWASAFSFLDNLPSGMVYMTTKWKINNIVCPGSESYPEPLVPASEA